MKYPQLVSTKAVNEISDWLIKRLEDLDIEQPGVYSRLLLSLLHTPFKVNATDLLEDLKQPHHLLRGVKSNEDLKRLAARELLESLMEVSAEQNKSNIINLVNELHSKLRRIETNCEESGSMNSRTTSSLNSSPISNSKFYKNLKKIKKNHGMESSTKNYYLAFPALSGGNKNLLASTNAGTRAAPASNETTTLTAEIEMNKDLSLLSWSNLISKKNNDSSVSSKLNDISSNCGSGSDRIKTPLSRRKRRYGKTQQRKGAFPKSDVQFSTKTLTAYDNATPKKMQMVKNSSKKHQRNQYDSSKSIIRNNNNLSKNTPQLDLPSTGSKAPWDMDFKGHWEMDRDLISEFIQQQKGVHHRHHAQELLLQQHHRRRDLQFEYDQEESEEQQEQQLLLEDEDDVMLKCLPTKLIVDESPLHESDSLSTKLKPCNNKEALSISSLKSKFDENVKAIWSDGNDLMKPLTHEKNSLSLFNFNEQTAHHHHHFEVNAPQGIAAVPSEIYHQQHYQHQLQPLSYKNADFDYNNNNSCNQLTFYGSRAAVAVASKSGSSFTTSPKQFDQMLKSSDFIKSGTNLQTSIWSDGDFPSDAESLVFKEDSDTKDETNDTIYKNLSSIGAEIKSWQNQNNNNSSNNSFNDNADVTLFNHSDKSAFKKFRPLLTSTIIRANYHPLNKSHSERNVVVEPLDSSDNYLTSEKTHFSPIIRDGHTFVIDNNWDEIKYERSPSGNHLMYKNRRYKLWNNNGKMSDVNDDIDLMGIENDANEFTIKYMLSENDKEVQTNESDFGFVRPPQSGKSFLEINEEYCKRKIYDEYFKSSSEAFIGSKNKWRYINNAEDSNDYSFFSVNRVKENSNTLNPPGFPSILLSSNSSSSSISTITSSFDATAAVDQFESWRHMKLDNMDRVEAATAATSTTEYKQICMHRLWEQCVTCSKNNEDMHLEKPLPANRLMKDELQLDGDEIMNVIQNLYITGDYCDDDEEKDDNCDDFDMNHVYMNMILDDSMDGTCTLEDENKFYETNVDAKNQKNFTSNILEAHNQKDLLNLENFDNITLTKMQWQLTDKKPDINKDYEKYLKLLSWIKASLVTTGNNNDSNFCMSSKDALASADKNNNCCQSLSEVHRPKNRKRRHSTCQNFLENKRTSHEAGFTYRLNLDHTLSPFSPSNADHPPPPLLSENCSNLFFDADKMLKVNIEKILLIPNPCGIEMVSSNKDNIEGANYYRNILQQQHALIKQLDLTRPLTR